MLFISYYDFVSHPNIFVLNFRLMVTGINNGDEKVFPNRANPCHGIISIYREVYCFSQLKIPVN